MSREYIADGQKRSTYISDRPGTIDVCFNCVSRLRAISGEIKKQEKRRAKALPVSTDVIDLLKQQNADCACRGAA